MRSVMPPRASASWEVKNGTANLSRTRSCRKRNLKRYGRKKGQNEAADHSSRRSRLRPRQPYRKGKAGSKAAITPMDWIGLIFVSFLLPGVLAWLFSVLFRKIGWIKEDDMRLDL